MPKVATQDLRSPRYVEHAHKVSLNLVHPSMSFHLCCRVQGGATRYCRSLFVPGEAQLDAQGRKYRVKVA